MPLRLSMNTARNLCLMHRLTRSYANSSLTTNKVIVLKDTTLGTFKDEAFKPAKPALLPRGCFNGIPAIAKWFEPTNETYSGTTLRLNEKYLSAFASCLVPLELTTSSGKFSRIDQPLALFLSASNLIKSRQTSGDPLVSVYLAQASLSDLPKGLRADVPEPNIVLQAGKGDIYSSSIWLGEAPTNTPLHRDPNPNFFVQLAGKKVVCLFPPTIGQGIFATVQESIGGRSNALVRGEEMMMGKEKAALDAAVWGCHDQGSVHGRYNEHAWSAELEPGDALFIPKGWWHSVKGIGEGMTGSVNWWFR